MNPVELHKKYEFSPEVLDIIISGRSAIDSNSGFQIHSMEEADRFVRSYGYNLDNPIESAEIFGNYHESLNFIRKYFLQPENPDGLKIEIPRKIIELTDVRELFLMASLHYPGQTNDTQGIHLRNWACSILKVMHTIAHVDQDIRTSHFADIQKQILDRYYRIVQRDSEGKLYLGEKVDDPFRVNLVAFEAKPKKSRDSTLIKLLHKPENVAEDIFDRVGIRFITYSSLDALRVVKYLKDKMIVMPPNIKPSRSRNTLIDLEDFKVQSQQISDKIDHGASEAEITSILNQAAHAQAPDTKNVHSSEYYRAIQFTGRQLIKQKNPLYDDLKELKSLLKADKLPEAATKIIERIDLKYLQKEVRFFYPYEVQIVDQVSHEENEKGRSAHSEYKRAQLNTAMKRVMGALMDASK